jgi:hypothetical protein
MVALPYATTRCMYGELDTGIVELTFTEASREAVDELLLHMDEIYRSADANPIVRVLVDHRNVGMQPVTYMYQKMREWNASHRVYFSSRAAILIDDTFLVRLVDSLLKTVLRTAMVEIRYFTSGDRDAAIRWLLGD